MYRTILASLSLVALVSAAPIMEGTKTVEARQLVIGDPTNGGHNPEPTFILLPPITGPIKPSDKRDVGEEKRQFSWGDPPTTWWPTDPPASGGGDISIGDPIGGGINPSDRQNIVASDDKSKIKALELEYETLLHTFGTGGPKVVQQRLKAIKNELLHKYGITIVQSPDGTSTTFVPGKRDFIILPGGTIPGGPMVPDTPVPGGPIKPST